MKRITLTLISFAIAISFSIAQKPYVLTSGDLEVMGTSTLHDWASTVKVMAGKAQINIDEQNALAGLTSFTWSCKATDLISEHGSIMDKNSWKALDSDHYPTISYKLKNVEKISPAGGGWELVTVGDLTLHGVQDHSDECKGHCKCKWRNNLYRVTRYENDRLQSHSTYCYVRDFKDRR